MVERWENPRLSLTNTPLLQHSSTPILYPMRSALTLTMRLPSISTMVSL